MDDMILYMDDPKYATHTHTQNLLELVHEFSKDTVYEINVQKWVTFVYTNNETIAQRYIKESIPFTISKKPQDI